MAEEVERMSDKGNSLIFGFHAVFARVRYSPNSVSGVFVDKKRRDARIRKLEERLNEANIDVSRYNVERLNKMVPGVSHQGVIASIKLDDNVSSIEDIIVSAPMPQLLVVLDGVTDPRNLGAIMRSACAFGASAVIVPKDRSVGITDVVEKVASGAAGIIPLITVTNLARSLRALKDADFWVVGTDGDSKQSIREFDFPSRTVLVFGAEGDGARRLTKETCDHLVSIPIGDVIESLNVGVSVGICLYEATRIRF
jgi:23S rRNA (guanosine2251-2'-O)-methyltransferase